MKYLVLLFSNLKRHRLRTALTILTIFIAFLLFGYLSAIERGITGGVTLAGQSRLIVRHKVSIIQLLPISYKTRIARVPGVEAVTFLTWFGGNYQDPKNFFPKMPVVPEEFLDLSPEYQLDDAAKKRWLENRTGAIVGETLANKYGFKVGDRVPIQGNIWMKKGGESLWEFDVVGIYTATEKSTDTSQMFFRYDYFDEARERGEGEVGWFVVRITDPERAAEVAAAIDAEFENSPAETKAEPEGAFISAFAQQVGDITRIMLAILAAVFFTILLVSGNSMAQSIRERTAELGVFKALGFGNFTVLILVLAESCLIAGLGGALGLGLAYGLISAGIPTLSAMPVFYFPTDKLLLGILMIFALGLLTGAVPAWQAMRLQINEALRRN